MHRHAAAAFFHLMKKITATLSGETKFYSNTQTSAQNFEYKPIWDRISFFSFRFG